MPQAGEQIGPYTLVRQLGRGAFGIVWLAERRGAFATTQVALKLILDDEPDLEAIAQESQLWAKLGGHPNVLPIIEADKYDDYIVIVSEYAPDGTLNDWLKKHNGIAPSIEAATSITIGILNGLEHLHSKKIIHRDLKPANILLQNDTPRLADFGLARVLRSSMKSGGVAGTPAYMAPEVFDGERSVESDLWSVGVILYQMLAGRLPFPQADLMALLGAIMRNDAELLPNYVPFSLAQVVAKSLQKNPANRYQSVAEMRNSLQNICCNNEDVPITLRVLEKRSTLTVDTAKQGDAEQTMATLAQLPTAENTLPKKIASKTVENPAVRATQESISQNVSTINSQDIPNIGKFSQEKIVPKSDNEIEKLKNKAGATVRYVAIFTALFLTVWIIASKFSSLSKIDSEASKVEKTISKLNSLPNLPPPTANVDIVDENVIKDNNVLAMEIGKKLAVLEKELDMLPKGKEKTQLKEVLEEFQGGFEEVSSEESNPETLKTAYERYFTELNSLMAIVEVARLSTKTKVKILEAPNNKAANSSISLPPSPDIVVSDEKLFGSQPLKTVEIPGEPPDLSNIPSPEDLKELKRRTKETRQFFKEVQRKAREKQSELTLPPQPLRQRLFEKAARGQEKRQE